ncbi:MAG: ATP-binding protein [Candidatus Acidiferrum sp.]
MEDRASRIIERARIPKRYEHCDFESYSTDVSENPQHSSSLKAAKLLAEKFVSEYPGNSEKGLMLMGPSGVGKTHLAVACIKELIRRGHQGLFCDYREFLKDIQASYNPGSESTELRILEPIRTIEVLVLDDLGASKPSAWVLDTIGLVLNARYNSRLTTLITTNYLDASAPTGKSARTPQGEALKAVREDTLADRIGERMRSRLFEMCRTIEVHSIDFRREVGQSSRARA